MPYWSSLENLPVKQASTNADARLADCRNQSESCSCPHANLSGSVTLITGGNASIGLETTRGLLNSGAQCIIACRSTEKAEQAVNELKKDSPAVSFVSLDLSDLNTLQKAVSDLSKVLTGGQQISILVENAGVLGGNGEKSAQGYELAFATNVLGHFALRRMLLREGLLAENARVVVVTGDIYFTASPPECTHDYSGESIQTYKRSCLGRLWIAAELQRRMPLLHVVSVHPGVFFSNLFGPQGNPSSHQMDQAMGAQTSLFAATQPVEKGIYLHNTQGMMLLHEDDPAMDRHKAHALWDQCETLAAKFVP